MTAREARLNALCEKLRANDPSFDECDMYSYTNNDEMRSIIAALKRNKTLERLELCGGNLSDATATVSLALALISHPKLKKLSIHELEKEEFGPVSLAFQQNERLSSLVLIDSHIFLKNTTAHLCSLLETNALTSLNLHSCYFRPTNDDDEESQPLDLKALASNTSLKELHVANSPLSEETIREIPRFLRQNQCLETLHLNVEMSDLMQCCVASAVQHHKSLRKLTFYAHDMKDVIAEEFGNVAQSAPNLRSLDLSRCHMKYKGLCQLLKGLKCESCRLEELNLNGNNLGSDTKSATALADFIRNDTKLKVISLAGNNIGDDGAALLASALEDNGCLRSLSLHCSNIGPVGANRIANALISNKSLCRLDLKGNIIEDEGLISLFEALKTNLTLERLDVRCTDEASMKAIMEGLKGAKGLKRLWAYSYNAPPSMVTDIANVIEEHNTTLELFTFRKSKEADTTKLNHLLELNHGGRRLLRNGENAVPKSLWAHILGRSSYSPNVLFHFLSEKPELCRKSQRTTTGKRKRNDDDSD